MSMQTAASLLQQYNKKSPYKKTQPIDSKADQSNRRFGTWSYVNRYDALYDKYSQDKNFNINMWRDAVKLGEQDQYLAFLEQNKDNTLSQQFYDPQYYDYEAMMMEMYLPLADNTKLEKYTQDVFDPVSGKWITEELGEMTQRQYYEYLLSNTRAAQADKITKDLEQWNKDQMTFWETLGHDAKATFYEFGEGLLSAITGVIDFVGGLGYASYAFLAEGENWADAYVNYFGELGLTALEKDTVRAALDEYERTHTHFKDIDGNMTGVGTYVAGIANSMGMMVPAILLSIPTGGTSLTWLPSTTFYMSIFSGNMHENATSPYRADSPSGVKILNAAFKTGAEYVVEWGLGKLLGGTIQNKMIGLGGKDLGQSFANGFSKTSGLQYFFKSAGQEGLEEFLQDFSTNCIDQFTGLIYKGYGNTGVTFQTLIDAFCVGALSSMFMSSGHIAMNAAKSGIQNKVRAGSGDMLIETEEGPQKVTGFNRLYYSHILSDFQGAVNELKRGKFNTKKNIELAQEVYGAMSAIAQFYSSFDAERLKNCEMLLDSVVKAEKFAENHERAASILSDKTIKQATKFEVMHGAQSFASYVDLTFRSMVGSVALKHAANLQAAAEKAGEKLTEEGGVTEVTGAIDKDGIQYKKNPKMAELEERLGKKAVDVLDELRKGYEWVITTDGHIAYESDGYLFVSEAWLQNYKTSDIYKYLEQTRILESLASDKMLAPMVKKLVAFDKEFTGQKDVNAERALMDLLFNESVYQAFILSNTGKNTHEFKTFIFQLHEIVMDRGKRSKYYQQLFKGKQSQVRINMLNQIYAQIQNTMRKPTLVAILNWGIDPQVVGADSVLTPEDRLLVKKYKAFRETILNGGKKGKDISAYEHLIEDIVADADFTDRQLTIIHKSRNGTATIDEEIEARALLEEADRRMTSYDFEVSPEYSQLESRLARINGWAQHEAWYYATNEIDAIFKASKNWDLPKDLQEAIEAYDEYTRSLTHENYDEKSIYLKARSIVNTIRDFLRTHSVKNPKTKRVGLGAFTIPHQAAAIAMNEGDIAGAQFVSDKLDEFKTTYGISARQMITGDLTGMSMQQRNQLTQDMETLKVNNTVNFVVKKLESMLGGKYIVTPTAIQDAGKRERTFRDVPRSGFSTAINALQAGLNSWAKHIKRVKNVDAKRELSTLRKLFDGFDSYAGESEDLDDLIRRLNTLVFTFDAHLKSGDDYATVLSWVRNEALPVWAQTLTEIDMYSFALDHSELEHFDSTNIYDFVIAKTIPAEKIISHDILNESKTTRDNIFRKVFNESRNKDIIRAAAKKVLSTLDTNDPYFDYFDSFSHASDPYIDDAVHTILVGTSTGDTIDPFTGEILDDTDPRKSFYRSLRGKLRTKNAVPLSAFIDMSALPIVNLDKVMVYFEDAGEGNAGWAAGNKIVIDPMYDDFFGTLVHEVNHVLQDKYNMPNGFNINTAAAMPDFLAYVVNHYPEYVKYTLYRGGYDEELEIPNIGSVTEQDVLRMPKYLQKVLAHCGYMLVQGELWARAYDHNGKMVHGFAEIFGQGGNYLLAPDGKTKFKVRYGARSTSEALAIHKKDLETEMTDVLKVIDKIYSVNFYGRAKAYENESLLGWVAKFYETSQLLFSNTFKTFLEPTDRNWIDTFVQQLAEPSRSKDVLKVIADNRAKVKSIYQKTIANIEKASASASASIRKETSYVSDVVAGSALDIAIQNFFLLKAKQENRGYAATSRNTYHSMLTRMSSKALTDDIMRPDIPFMVRISKNLQLKDIIRDPQSYLKPEILEACRGDFSEGNVFYRVKEYIESKHNGISIDINNRQEYIWVNDDGFDDLYLLSMRNRTTSDKTSIVEQFSTGEHIPLTRFYKRDELARLGINPSAYVVISPDVKTETAFDNEHRSGAIFIKSTTVKNNEIVNRTDAQILNALNHEFRHLLQYYNGFATGFTPEFKVSREMIADVKEHVPGLFKNTAIVHWAKALGKEKWEEFLVQHFVYFTTSGELMAYAFNASELHFKPSFVNKEAGNPTIFMPWYNADTGEGRHQTEYLAMREEDAKPKTGEQFVSDKLDEFKTTYGISAKQMVTGDLTGMSAQQRNQLTQDMDTLKANNTADFAIRKLESMLGNKYIVMPTAEVYLRLPSVNKRPKHTAVKVESLDAVDQVLTYVYNTRRDFSAKKAKGTNLEYFIKKGQRNQMDPDLQEFIIATTGHEKELPPELWNVIGGSHKGTLTKQALFRWFRQVDASKVNEFTFDLLNKYIFKNDHINSMKELDDMLTNEPSFYWAAAVVLSKEGLALESLINENDVKKFLSFINSLEGTEWKKKIEDVQVKFGRQRMRKKGGGVVTEDLPYSEKVQNYMRVLTMQWFDGSLAGAFYAANSFRKVWRRYEDEVRGILSLNAKRGNAKGDKEISLEDQVTAKNSITGTTKTVANDIIAIYESEMITEASEEEMIQALSLAYYQQLLTEEGLDPDTMSKAELMPITEKVITYQQQLSQLSTDEIIPKYNDLKNAEMTDTQVEDTTFTKNTDDTKNSRARIVQRIKTKSDALLKLIRDGKIAFSELPQEIQDMYELVDAKTANNKKTKVYELKPSVYSVGRGRAKLPGTTDKVGRLNYAGKHNITEGNAAFRHDVSTILANEELLKNILYAARQEVKLRKGTVKKTYARGEKAANALAEALRAQKVPNDGKARQTEFKMSKKKKRTSDTPNVFNIVSNIDMPDILHKILDTSFEDMANTEVQFASRDENGQLYDKSQFKKGEFESRVQHEINNWDAFYEANRNMLISLTRNNVLDIIEFFHRGAYTVDGPSNKLAAFEIFLLGYFVDAARHNHNNWDFSDKEIEIMEQLYEQKASAHGSGLNAVQQMLKVVDPLKRIKQRMFDEWEAVSDDDKDELIKAVDKLQAEKDLAKQKEIGAEIIQMLKDFGKRQAEFDKDKYPRWSKAWWRRFGEKVKAWRYTAMLSGPATWLRNLYSNILVTAFNKTSDVVGNIVFLKKGYRKEQWDLNGVKISSDAKTFIDTHIKSNPIFDPLYDLSSKYDSRQSKKIADEKGLLVSLIAKAYEKKYTQGRRFDSAAMKNVAKFIDKMISDKRFVKFVASRYYGKILTIEAERGNVDLSQGLSSTAMDLFAESVILANFEYMHKRSFAADMLDSIRDKYPKLHEALTFWQPFLNSSFNWFAESFKYTPLGLANSIVRACKLETQITKLDNRRASGEMVTDSRAAEFLIRRDVGKGVVGLMLSALGIMLAFSGRLRIEEDDDKFYMFVDEDVKLDISNLFGSSSLLVGASIAQLWIKQADGDIATFEEMLSLVTDTILDGFFATDLLERHKWGGTWDDLLTETESVMRSFVPQIWQTIIACTNNQRIRYSSGFTGMWERWLNTFVPTQPLGNRRINPYTGEIEDAYSLPIIGALLQKGVLGPKIYWVEVSELERMCRELGVNKNELTGELTVNDKKFELDRLALNKKYGELNKESLSKITSQKHKVEMPDGTFKTLSWDAMDDKQRARVLSRTMTQNAEIAKIYIWTQVMGKKFYASTALWQTLRHLGLVQNVYKGDKDFVE